MREGGDFPKFVVFCSRGEGLEIRLIILHNLYAYYCYNIHIRSSWRRSAVIAMDLAQSEDVISRLFQMSKDSDVRKEVKPAVLENDVVFIKVHEVSKQCNGVSSSL